MASGFSTPQNTALDQLKRNHAALSADHVTIWNFHEPRGASTNRRIGTWIGLSARASTSSTGTAGMPTAFRARWSNELGPTLAGYAEYDAVTSRPQDNGNFTTPNRFPGIALQTGVCRIGDLMLERLNAGDLIDMMGARFELVARLGAGESDTALFRTRMPPGKLVPLHSHVDPECFYLLEGEIEVFVVVDEPKWRSVGAGRSILLADGVRHAVRNPTENVADIVLATNNRFASFLAEAGRRAAPGAVFSTPSLEDIQRVRRVSEAYGYWNASPAESAAVTG